jgi:hypothetical protein
MECKIHCWNARGENGGVYGVAWVPWHGAQQIFARPSWAQRGQISALRLPGAPLIARRCSAIAPEHFATIGGHVGSAGGDLAWRPPSPALGPGRSRQRATPRHPGMPQRAWPRALRCPHRSAQLHHRRAFRALGHSPCCRRRRCKSSVCSFNGPPASKRMCGTGASASARLVPWKGHRRCPFPRRKPPRHLRPSWPRSRTSQSICAHFGSSRLLSQATSERLRSRLDPLDRQ